MKAGETRMLDWRGQEIKVGDIVVYPVRQSSQVWMVEGRVEELHSLIENRWKSREEPEVPTQVGGVTVTRLRATGWRGDDIKPDHRVKVGLDRLTVVIPVEAIEFARYPVRYLVTADDEGVPQAIQGFNGGPDEIWNIGGSDIEIDGRAT